MSNSEMQRQPNIPEGIELEVIHDFLRSGCQTDVGRRNLNQTFSGLRPQQVKACFRLQDVLQGLLNGDQFDFSMLVDLEQILDDKKSGGLWVGSEWSSIIQTLRVCRQAMRRFSEVIQSKDASELLPSRALDKDELSRVDFAITDLTAAIDPDGRLKDDASPELLEKREQIRKLRVRIYQALEKIMEPFRDKDILVYDEPTLRKGRHVLAIRSGFQNRIKGLIHDTSQTDQTVFVEPESMLGLGNELKLLQSEEEEIEQELWFLFSGVLIEHRPLILRLQDSVGLLDALATRLQFSQQFECVRPKLIAPMMLKDARSPVLLLNGERRISAIDAELQPGRALMISGQNAGGKTAALKTLGAIAYLVTLGCDVPVGVGSQVPVFEGIATMVGDGQNLSIGLSSLQADAERFKKMLELKERAGQMLLLLDEPCGNTEPESGSALAQAMIEALISNKSSIVCTTHYARLKHAPLAYPDLFRGAAVRVSSAHGYKKYELVMDDVGASAPFQVALESGIPSGVIQRAENLVGGQTDSAEDLLTGVRALEAERRAAIQQAELEAEKARRLVDGLEQQRLAFAEEKKALETKVREELKAEIKKARALMTQAVQAHQRGAGMTDVSALNQALIEEEKKLDAQTEPSKAQKPATQSKSSADVVRVGDRVHAEGFLNAVFEVIEVKGQQLLLQKGPIQIRKTRKEVEVVEDQSQVQKRKAKVSSHVGAKTTSVTPRNKNNTLDLRGKRVDEAEDLLEAFADRAVKGSWDRIFVLHGHGTGALRKWLKSESPSRFHAKRMYPAPDDQGGAAYTILEF